jgi:hypothetical protein
MTPLWFVAAALLAAAPAESQPAARQLRAAVSEALRREATTAGARHQQALRDLVAVFNQLEADSQLPDVERRERLGQVRSRLARASEELLRQVADPPVAGARAAPGGRGGAQNTRRSAGNPARGAGGRSPDAQGAADLIDLIQTTIAPDSWDVRGGPGTIMYFAPRQVLVIRQTGEVHDQFRDLVRQLRR